MHDFEEGFDGEFDGGGAVEVFFVVAFEEFADGFGGAADGVGFPVGRGGVSTCLLVKDT